MSGIFGIARSALLTHQSALQTISNNIANSETPGYSRQETLLQASIPTRMSYGSVGTGVEITTIVRRRDELLDEGFRSANAMGGNAELRRDLLNQVEEIFGEPSDTGMSSSLDAFFNSWSDLAASPNSGPAKAVVQQRGRQLSQLFNDYNTQLVQQNRSATDRLNNTVLEVNMLASQVAELNNRIVASETGGHTANDLRDSRDMLLDRFTQLTGAKVFSEGNGAVSVVVGNSTMVSGSTAQKLTLSFVIPNPAPAVTPSTLPVQLRLGGSPSPLPILGGEIGALGEIINNDIPELRGRLDALAASIVESVNAEHTQNFVFNGNVIPGSAAGNFFYAGTALDPIRAGNMRLSDTVAADSTAITASRDANAPSDNSGALALSSIRDVLDTVTYTDPHGNVESASFLGFFRTSVTRLGLQSRTAKDDASVYKTLSEQANRRRQSVSGVNTDEELVKMLRVQQAYTAATKLIKAADEMMQTILTLV